MAWRWVVVERRSGVRRHTSCVAWRGVASSWLVAWRVRRGVACIVGVGRVVVERRW
ncbi:hypothetical protein ACXZ9C_11310 [Streptococcus agalactiae]